MSAAEQDERGQVGTSAAEVYEGYFVPALFAPWAPRVAEAARIGPDDRVLDVGCGTGVLARHAATRVGAAGSVVGLDVNEEMLRVAARTARGIEWRQGSAEALPFEDGAFDAVVSQFALMFVPEPAVALAEMRRVAGPRGRIAVAVWDRLEGIPAYAAVRELLAERLGPSAAAALEPPFALGDPERLRTLCAEAGLEDVVIETHAAAARFPSIRSWMHTEIRGWTLSDQIDDGAFEALAAEAETRLARFRHPEGGVRFEVRAHIVAAPHFCP